MKNLLIILVLISAISCTKSINQPRDLFSDTEIPVGTYPSNQQDTGLTRDLGNGIILKVNVFATRVCDDNDSSKPCNMFISIGCNLSKAVNKYVQVELIKTNVLEKNEKTSGAEPMPTLITVTLAPDMKDLVFNSNIKVSPNERVAPEEFKISKVTIFQKKD